MIPAFQGEVQLLRWSETSNQGATITLQLADAADLERFKTMTLAKKGMVGQRLAAVMVQIGDDEQPVEQTPFSTSLPTPRPGMLCIMACTFCADPIFAQWAANEFCGDVSTEDKAKKLILDVCLIASRKELDIDKDAAQRFHALIREPFMVWKAKQSANPNDARRAA